MVDKSLSQLLSQGWMVHMRGVMEIDTAPISPEKISAIRKMTDNRATHIVFLKRRAGEQGMLIYPIQDDAELELARREVDAGKRIIGYDIRITCCASSLDGEVRVGSIAQNVRKLMGWEVQVDAGEMTFNVVFRTDGDSRQEGQAKIDELEDVLIALSIKNRFGCNILNISWGPKYAAQPFALWTGRVEVVPVEIDHSDIEQIRELREKGGERLIPDLVRFYGHDSPRAKMVFGFSLLEGLFDEKPDHILEENEIAEIQSKATEIASIASSEEKQKRLREVLSNPSLMPKRNRNERIAAKIAVLMNISEADAYSEVRTLSRLRGNLAHSTKEETQGLLEASAFIEEVLLRYLISSQRDARGTTSGGT